MRTLTVKVPEALDAAITAVARERGTTRSDVVRHALLAAVHPREVTMEELIGDLVGCVEGPGDLATNPAHMEGFGR